MEVREAATAQARAKEEPAAGWLLSTSWWSASAAAARSGDSTSSSFFMAGWVGEARWARAGERGWGVVVLMKRGARHARARRGERAAWRGVARRGEETWTSAAAVAGFDLNVRLEEDEDGNVPFHLNEPILEDHNNMLYRTKLLLKDSIEGRT
uniref:Uncharacterized protein n=1 Tax=Oryza barthii TaxID=65489 RepID=A0A0D3HUZ7_9ORYZ